MQQQHFDLKLDFIIEEENNDLKDDENLPGENNEPIVSNQEDIHQDIEIDIENDILVEQNEAELEDLKHSESELTDIDIPNLKLPTQVELSIDPPHEMSTLENAENKDIDEDITIDDNWNNDINIDIDDTEEPISSNNEEKDEEDKSNSEPNDNSNQNAATGFYVDTPRKDLDDEDIFKFNPSKRPSSVIEYEEVGEELIKESSVKQKEFERDLILAGGQSDEEEASEEQKHNNDDKIIKFFTQNVAKEEVKIENIVKELDLNEDINNEDLDGLEDDAWGADIELDINNDLNINEQDQPTEDNVEDDINLKQSNDV